MAEKTQQALAEETRNGLLRELDRLDRLYGLGDRACEAAEELEQELVDRPLEATVRVSIDVLLTTGGPAAGVLFECERDGDEMQMLSARVWHQDWFTGRGWAVLDRDAAERLWDTWGLALATL